MRYDPFATVSLARGGCQFYGWTQQQADALRAGNLASLDLDNLIEEIETMGRSEKRELTSRLELLLVHLLKWAYQPDFRSKNWQFTVDEHRDRIADHLRENPSLKSKLSSCMQTAYKYVKRGAARETRIDAAGFPAQCPWTFDQAMNDGFWPDA